MFFSELSNEEWSLVSELIGEDEVREHRRGRPKSPPRTVVNAVLWILTTGEAWSRLPRHFPTVPTCRRRFVEWQANGTLIEIVKVLSQAGRSFAYVPRQRVHEAPPRREPAAFECDRLRGVFWQNPESWRTPDSLPFNRAPQVQQVQQVQQESIETPQQAPQRLPDARDVAQSHRISPEQGVARGLRPVQSLDAGTPAEAATASVGDARGYSVYPIARSVSGGMYRGWAEVVKDGQRVERSGLIGPRFVSADEAQAYALEWAKRWITSREARAEAQRMSRSIARAEVAATARAVADIHD